MIIIIHPNLKTKDILHPNLESKEIIHPNLKTKKIIIVFHPDSETNLKTK